MLQCTAVRRLPARQTLSQILAADDPPDDLAGVASGYAVCELGAHAEGEHAAHMWDSPEPECAVWFLWSDTGHRFATLTWCDAECKGDACGLHAEHPSAHLWDVVDPTTEALAHDLAAHPECWGFPPSGF
ncbi:hypothetical protein [Streptomyces daliensis]|uniref:Uncharacterized protein n=1 Tax=Streptomyces daliensis TaxID=299421 RepID=A0A8T4J0E9_9ACTN|nr:hypothetical protein [Streptomyces daliensis]